MKKDNKTPFSVEITETDQYFRNIPHSLNEILEESVRRNWDLPALSDFKGETHTYGEVAEMIEKLHILFKAADIKQGEKIAICGKNSAKWATAFIACLTYGAVAVPILHEFKPETIHHLVNHSDAKLLFIDESIWKNLDNLDLPSLQGVLFISELGMPLSKSENLTIARENIEKFFKDKYPHGFSANDIHWYHDTPDELAVINYTSGSTGMSKGVMLPYRSIWSNIKFCMEFLTFLKPGDGVLNMLPLAHLYGMVIEMLHPFAKGCHCTFLGRTPSPAVLLSGFSEIQPKLIITVPLVLEKIVKSKIFPVIEQPKMKFLLKLPIIKGIILRKIKDQLIKGLGGKVKQVIIGGAALNADVNAFLLSIKFPVTVGYGMTECGPLITYETPEKTKSGTVGKIVERMEAKIDSPDPETVPGNLWVRGDNLMKGY
ncbi:MAG: AMP-binding protein, partial [Muribaculaceae bacterium]|nr:AMP-binding protein [Muribaculaceae bacterium]